MAALSQTLSDSDGGIKKGLRRLSLAQKQQSEAIAEVHSPYPAEGCEVIGAIEEPQRPAGTVHEILQQGYRDIDGHLVRGAKVIVCRGDQQRDISQQQGETNNVY